MRNKSIRKIILVILAIIFGLSPIIYNSFNDNDSFRNLEYGNRYNVKRNGYGVLSSIIIDDDDPSINWMTTAATYDWCSGSGTWNDPYIIENVVIDGQDSSNCLEIRDSILYFIIRNCTFYNAGPFGKAGILLYNVKNGILINLNCSDNNYGILLDESENNTVSGNIAYDNWDGIKLRDSKNNTVSENIANDNGDGIVLSGCENNIVSGNTANNNFISGINLFWDSSSNKVLENIVNHNSIGILLNAPFTWVNGELTRLYKCDNNIISGNIIKNNGDGMILSNSNDNLVLGNNINNNTIGISLDSANNNILYLNNFINNDLNTESSNSTNKWNSLEKILYTHNSNNYTNYLGNYWDTYTGNDADTDGIGDTPFTIVGDMDNYPLMEPIDNYKIFKSSVETAEPAIPGFNLFFLTGIIGLVSIIFIKKLKKLNNN